MQERQHLSSNAVIKVIGVGGGGGNAINTMIESGLTGVEFVAANTDVQALQSNLAPVKIQLGRELTKGLGAGANPDVGRDAALEDKAIIQEVLSGADMVFVTAGMGGGTGTGAAPIIAQVARELGALTVGVVTKPFQFEGKRRKGHCDNGISNLQACVDTLITIPNQRLLSIAPPSMSMLEGFKLADEVLLNAVKGISDIINIPGRVNVDFADVRTIMSEMGMALMGIGTASGDTRATDAARAAINSPLLEDVDIEGATGILINITGSSSLTLHEISEASTLIQEAVHEDANIIFGAVVDESMGDTIRVTVIATGFDQARVAFSDSTVRTTYQQISPQPGYGQGINAPGQHFGGQPNARPGYAQPNSGYDTRGGMNMNPNMVRPVPGSMGGQQHGYGQAPARGGHDANAQGFRGAAQGSGAHAPLGFDPNELQRRPAHSQGLNSARHAPDASQPQGNGYGQRAVNHGEPVQTGYEAPKASKSEFEELTQWTLEMSRNPQQGGTQGADRPITGAVTHSEEKSEPATENAFQLAEQLSEVELDENDFETPAFMRRKDDPHRNM